MNDHDDEYQPRHGRRNTDQADIQVMQHRIDAVEGTLRDHKVILGDVSDSLKQLVMIEANTRKLLDKLETFEQALHGTSTTKGLFTRVAEAETRINHQTRLWMYIGGAIGAGIVWGIGQIALHMWLAVSRATGG